MHYCEGEVNYYEGDLHYFEANLHYLEGVLTLFDWYGAGLAAVGRVVAGGRLSACEQL